MIRIRMSVADLGRTRFAFSPLAEVAESLYMLDSGAVHPLHRSWFDNVQPVLDDVDLELLHAVVPARPLIADFFFAGATDPTTTIEQQLKLVEQMPATELARELEEVWQGEVMPRPARALIALGRDGPRHLAESLGRYWSIAIERHWQAMRAVLDDDVAFRASELTRGGVAAMLADLTPDVSMHGDVLSIDKRLVTDQQLGGIGLLLVPSVFVWPNVVFALSATGSATLTYPARGVGNLWRDEGGTPEEDRALGALLGRSRAQILIALELPHSTTEIAVALGQSASSVSQHLSVLRRAGLVTSWRSGRSVLYRRTDLATSVVDASCPPAAGATTAA